MDETESLNLLNAHNKVVNKFMIGLRKVFEDFIGKIAIKSKCGLSKEFKQALDELAASVSTEAVKASYRVDRSFDSGNLYWSGLGRLNFKTRIYAVVKSKIDDFEWHIEVFCIEKHEKNNDEILSRTGWIDQDLLLRGIPSQLQSFKPRKDNCTVEEKEFIKRKMMELNQLEIELQDFKANLFQKHYAVFFPQGYNKRITKSMAVNNWERFFSPRYPENRDYSLEMIDKYASNLNNLPEKIRQIVEDLQK